jgi:hypothetical protein
MSGKSTLRNFKSMLAEAALPETVVPVCLRGDLAADHELAERELEQAQKAATDSLAGNGAAEIAERIEGIEGQMREHSYDFRLRALPRREWRELVAAHPARRDENNKILDEDSMGVDSSTFFDAMIRACLVDPELDDAEWEALNAALTDRQFDDLSSAAWGLNRREIDIPFSRAASRMRRATAAE